MNKHIPVRRAHVMKLCHFDFQVSHAGGRINHKCEFSPKFMEFS